MPRKVIIAGSQGREFHVFNMFYKNNRDCQVVAFTSNAQSKSYPKGLSGKLYPKGIPIYPEKYLPQAVKKFAADEVVFAGTDIPYSQVMQMAAVVMSCGADFKLAGPESTMLKSKRFVISVCGVRTGDGKSPVSRRVCQMLKAKGINFVVVRHPIPGGDLSKMAVQRIGTRSDMDALTIEEREEYQPHIDSGSIVYSGIDYEQVLREAEKEAKVIVWEGSSNDLPFIRPDVHIVVADARRPGHETTYYPSEVNLRMADIVIINKVDSANPADVEAVARNVSMINPRAALVRAAMPIFIDKPELVKGRRILVVEDGPSLTQGGLAFGVGSMVAKNLGAYMISPRGKAAGSISDVYTDYPQLGAVLPVMGYSRKQLDEIEQTINSVDCDSVLIGTPVDLRGLISINKPAARVKYEVQEIGKPNLEEALGKFLKKV